MDRDGPFNAKLGLPDQLLNVRKLATPLFCIVIRVFQLRQRNDGFVGRFGVFWSSTCYIRVMTAVPTMDIYWRNKTCPYITEKVV